MVTPWMVTLYLWLTTKQSGNSDSVWLVQSQLLGSHLQSPQSPCHRSHIVKSSNDLQKKLGIDKNHTRLEFLLRCTKRSKDVQRHLPISYNNSRYKILAKSSLLRESHKIHKTVFHLFQLSINFVSAHWIYIWGFEAVGLFILINYCRKTIISFCLNTTSDGIISEQ